MKALFRTRWPCYVMVVFIRKGHVKLDKRKIEELMKEKFIVN